MRVAILSRRRQLYSTRRLAQACEQRGHEVRVLDTLKCYMDIATLHPKVHYRSEVLAPFDAVIPRIGASVTFYGAAVLRQFEMTGAYPLNESVAITRSRDKLRSLQILARAGVGLPVTGFASAPDDIQDLIRLVGGPPLVVKLLRGIEGRNVVLAETRKAAESLVDAFRELDADFLVQQYIGEAGGSSIRCLVVGEKVVAAIKREASEGESRGGLYQGRLTTAARITPEERATAVSAANRLGLNVAGVDIVRSNQGPLVIDVNSSPGLEAVEEATGKDVAKLIVDFVERNARPHRTRTRGRG